MEKQEYFIGWNNGMPDRNKRALRRLLMPLFLLIPVLAFLVVYFMKPFNDHQFEFGNVKTFTGWYFDEPLPVLILDENQTPEHSGSQALVVGYGKHGATGFIRALEETKGPLSGKRITIQGTLIYGDGKTLIELTRAERTVVEVLEERPKRSFPTATVQEEELIGEIIDPKCWFGVMKPGEGKVHKSCAIRCVSGGIPPVLRVKVDGENLYYLIRGKNGADIHREILQYIAEPVVVRGDTHEQNGWKVIQMDPKTIRYQN